jgi:hypothetical protein
MRKDAVLLNWLMVAFQQAVENKTEHYYFDKQNEEFFSIHLLDLFLLEENRIEQHKLAPQCTEQELIIRNKRIQLIQSQHSSIVQLPRYGMFADQLVLTEKIELFLIDHGINIKNASLFEAFQREEVIKRKGPPPKKKPWWQFWM